MKTRNRVLSFFLAVLMFVTALPLTALQVSAARTLSYIPEITSIDMDDYEAVLNDQDQVRYLYAYANDDIYSEYDCTIEWDDVCDYYYLVIKFLDGNPAPGGDTSSETGYTWIVKEKKDHYEKNSITIPQSVLDKYTGKYMKVCIVGHDNNGDGTHRCDSYVYIDDGLTFDFSDFSHSQEITLGEKLTWSGEVFVNDYLNLDAVSISIKKPDGSAIYYRETDIGNDWFFTEDIQDGCIPTNDVAPTGVFPNGEGGYDKVRDFIIDEPGTYELYVSASIENGQYTKQKYQFTVVELSAPSFSVDQDEIVTCDWNTPYVPDVQITQGSGGPITKVSVALYTQKENNSGVKYFTESLNGGESCVDLLEIMKYDEIVWGEKVTSATSGQDFDTNTLTDQAYIYIWVVDGDGTHTRGYHLKFNNKPTTFSVGQDEVVTCDWDTPYVPDVQIAQGSSGPITKVSVALYTQKANNSGVKYFTESFGSEKNYVDLLEIMEDDEIVWGEEVASNVSGGIFDTNNLGDQAYIYIWAVDKSGTTHTCGYYLDFINKPAVSQIVGDINGDGEITNKDRFLLNRFVAGMAGYTNINKTVADINGDGSVNKADAEYLSNHLAGVKGFESFPEYNPECAHTNYTPTYAGKTVFVNNTIKNDGVHSYYHVWSAVCNECGENLGTFQGNERAEKGAIEKNVPCSYNSDGVCSCGAINTTGYTPWTAKNITDKQISVYDTPYSTDGSYGKVFVDESVRVLGSKAGRYLIEYTVTSTSAKKQGYVNASFLASASNYRLEFEFETITLPVSGRTVLLIPKNGSAFYHLYDGNTKLSVDKTKLKINFENPTACEYGTTTITGKVGGFGTLSVIYTVNGVKYNLQCPDYYVVADSSEIYTSGNINVFSAGEEEYISTALDIYFSQNDIKVPYELYWSAGENFALCIEKLDDILASLLKDGSATENDYARVLSEFIDKYVKVENSAANDTIDELDASIIESLGALLNPSNLETIKSGLEAGDGLIGLIDEVLHLINASKFDANTLKQLHSTLLQILKHKSLKIIFEKSPELAKAICKGGVALEDIVVRVQSLVDNTVFWEKLAIKINFSDIVGVGLSVAEFGVSFSVTAFGNWDRHREVLVLMQSAIESIPVSERGENYETLVKAMELLIDMYDTEFWDKIGNGFKESLPNLAVDLAKFGLTKVLGSICPVAAGAMALLDIASFFIENFTKIGEESDVIRMRQFYLAFNKGILNEFESLYDNGQTFSAIYSTVNDTVRMFLNMAIYINDIAQDVSEYTDADKAVYKKNIENIKTQFRDYLY